LVRGQVGGRQFQVQEVLAAGEVQCRGRGRGGLTLLQQVGDIITAVRLKSEGIVNGAGHGVRAVEFAQGNDLLDVVGGREAFFLQLAIIRLGLGRQVEKGRQQGLLAGADALGHQFTIVIGVADVLAAVVATGVRGDQFFAEEKDEPVRVNFEGELLAGVEAGDGIEVGVKGDAAAAAGGDGLDDGGVMGLRWQRAQGGFLPGRKQLNGFAMGFAVDADIGHLAQPLVCGGAQCRKAGNVQAVEEVAFDIADGVFDAAFFIGLAHAAGDGAEAVMGGKVQIPGMKQGGRAQGMAQHAGLEVVNHDFPGDAAEKVEGPLMAGEEPFHALAQRKLDVQEAAVTEHHDEKGEAAAGRSHRHPTRAAPVNLGTFARGKGQGQISGFADRTQQLDQLLEDAVTAVIALGFELLEDLLAGIGMAFQERDDPALEGIELAGPPALAAGKVMVARHPFGHRLGIQFQPGGDLRGREVLLVGQLADLAETFVTDHW